jgi:uncharacterized integral membrane protein
VKSVLRIVLAAAVALYTAAIVAANSKPVTVELWFASVNDVPLWLPLVLALVISAVVTGLLLSVPLVRLRLQLRRQSRRVQELEQEVHGLRMLPIGEDAAAGRGQAREA